MGKFWTEATDPQPAKTPATEGEAGPRRMNGVGGGGRPKPSRRDPLQQRAMAWVPGQQEGLAAANAVFYSPAKRRAACRRQQEHSPMQYDAVCPLSPVLCRPCVSPDCHCNISHEQLSMRLMLGHVRQVCPGTAPPPGPLRFADPCLYCDGCAVLRRALPRWSGWPGQPCADRRRPS